MSKPAADIPVPHDSDGLRRILSHVVEQGYISSTACHCILDQHFILCQVFFAAALSIQPQVVLEPKAKLITYISDALRFHCRCKADYWLTTLCVRKYMYYQLASPVVCSM